MLGVGLFVLGFAVGLAFAVWRLSTVLDMWLDEEERK